MWKKSHRNYSLIKTVASFSYKLPNDGNLSSWVRILTSLSSHKRGHGFWLTFVSNFYIVEGQTIRIKYFWIWEDLNARPSKVALFTNQVQLLLVSIVNCERNYQSFAEEVSTIDTDTGLQVFETVNVFHV